MWEESLARTRPRRDRQRLVLPQDRRLQPTQHRTRVDAELLSKRGPQPAKHCQRLGLTATPVQRHHQLPVHLLIQRAARRPLLQLRHQVRVFPRRQPRPHQRPPHLTGQQIQPPGLLLQPHRPAHIHQRPPRHNASAPRRSRAPCAGSAARLPCRNNRSAARASVPSPPKFSAYPGGRATIASRLPSTPRRYETCDCKLFITVAGATPPHTTSTSRPAPTTCPSCKASAASTAFRRSPFTGRTPPPAATSTGPSSRTCTTTPRPAQQKRNPT